MTPKQVLDQVLDLLPQLSEAGLQEVNKHIKALAQFHKTDLLDAQDDYLLQGVFYEIEWLGLAETIPQFFRIRNKASFNFYGEKSARLRAMLERHVPDLTLTEKVALGRLCIRCLREHVEKWRAIEFSSLLANIEHLPAALDNAFPGYIRNGALRVIVRSLTDPGRLSEMDNDGFDC